MSEEELDHFGLSFPPGLIDMEDWSLHGYMGFSRPPPGLPRPWLLRQQSSSPVPEAAAPQAFLTTTPPLPGSTVSKADPQYLSLNAWGPHRRCDVPLQELGIPMGDDARSSPDVRPLCPQPRRAFDVAFCEPSLPSSPSPVPFGGWGTASYSELPELPTPFEKKDLLADAIYSRPLSSVSTSAGPTPSPEEFRQFQVTGFQSPQILFAGDEPRMGEASHFAEEGEMQFSSVGDTGGHGAHGDLRRDRRRPSHCEGSAPSAPFNGASLEALLQEGQLTKSVVAEMSKTQVGSKLLQKKLLKGHPSVIQDILAGLESELPDIMCNMYGNYLCSAAFQSCSVAQRLRMLEITSRHLLTIGKDKWGTHALQSLLSLVCTNDEQKLLLPALKEHAVELSCDQHGTHVMQRAITSFGTPCPDVLLHRLAAALRKVAYNSHGLCVLKRCISQTRSGHGQQYLIQEMARQAVDLVQSPYGNYVVQHCFEELGFDACRPIIQAMKGKLLQLSLQKFSSNVVEYILRLAQPEGLGEVVPELAKKEQSHVLMSTVYGMHVAHQLLKVLNDTDRVALEVTYSATLRGNRNQRLRERWESLLSGTGRYGYEESDLPHAATPPSGGRLVFDGSNTPLNRRRQGRGDRSTPSKQQRAGKGSPEKGGKGGVLTPGLLVDTDR